MAFAIQPVDPRSSEPTAEVAAWILVDQIRYDELALVDSSGNALQLDANATLVQEIEKNPSTIKLVYFENILGSFQFKRRMISSQ